MLTCNVYLLLRCTDVRVSVHDITHVRVQRSLTEITMHMSLFLCVSKCDLDRYMDPRLKFYCGFALKFYCGFVFVCEGR